MSATDYAVNISLSVVLIVGAYQFYFFAQKTQKRRPRRLLTRLDSIFSLKPRWVWVYSGLYYPMIIYINITVDTMRRFNYIASSFLLLLGLQSLFFYMFPVAVPRSWRSINGNQSISTKFLSLVQRFDARTNCFPSMHVSVATLTAFHISLNQPLSAPWIFLFPLFISMSALFTKQHYFLDLPAGMLLGWLVFEFYLIYAHLT